MFQGKLLVDERLPRREAPSSSSKYPCHGLRNGVAHREPDALAVSNQQHTRIIHHLEHAGRNGAVLLDGQNVFVYHDASNAVGHVDVDFGDRKSVV